ncbi:MAG: PKD domain-containing protein [Geobacteraceae bacterium]|nr:PKD domain-containing protein [Geobacteraceae bacterium]
MKKFIMPIYLSALLGLVHVPSVFSIDIHLSVPEKIQEHDQWCWAGSSQAMLEYYGTVVAQCDIANWAWGRSDCCGNGIFYWANTSCNWWNYMWGPNNDHDVPGGSLQGILTHWGVNTNALASALSQTTCVAEINSGRPFLMRFGWPSGGGHFLVGDGYELDGQNLWYMDPWPGNGDTLQPYSWVVYAPDHHTWTSTLKGATNKLTVSKTGNGGGTVTSTPSGITCVNYVSGCSTYFPTGTGITLQAAPDSNSTFAGWFGGGCSGTGACAVTLTADTTITPVFTLLPPAADFSATPTSGLVPLSVNFTDNSLRANAWVWTFGDNSPASNLQNPSHTYDHAGTYSVTMQAIGTSGNSTVMKSNYITVWNPVSLTVNNSGTGGGTVTSTPEGISCGGTCSSFFGLGSAVTLQATPDADSAFTGWSGGGCSGTGACTISLNDYATVSADFTIISPVAGYSAFPTTGIAPFTVDFTDTSLRADTWSWNFGDGTTSSLQSPSHTYTQPGTYSVTLQASNASGSNTVTKNNLVAITLTPVNGVQILGSPPVSYSTLQAAFDAAQDGQVIQSQAVGFTEGLNLVNPVTVSLTGGYNGNFTTDTETTVVTGTLTITGGSLTVDKLAIK